MDRCVSRTLQTSGHADAQEAAPILRRVPVPARRPDVAGAAVPAPAAEHPGRGLEGTSWVVDGRLTIISAVEPVPAPIANVAVHIVQAPGVRCLLTHRMSPPFRV